MTATLSSGTSQSVAFSVSGLPLGASLSAPPASCTPTCISPFTINSGTAAAGTYTVVVTGTASGGLVRTTSFTLTVIISAPTFYIATTGSDSNPGTETLPWRTWAFSLAQLVPGDTLFAKNGIYNSASGSGFPNMNCASGYNNGTAALPITVRAQNERQAQIYNDAASAARVFWIRNCSYWVVEGLHVKQQDHNDGSVNGNGAVFIASGSNNLTLRRNLIQGADRYECDSSLVLSNTNNSLVEENEVYEYHRLGIQVQLFGGNNVIRRNYVNSRGLDDVGGGCSTVDAGQGDSGIIIYTGHDNIIENNIVERDNTGFKSISAGSVASSGNNKFYGNIARMTNTGITWEPQIPFTAVNPTNNTAVNFVSLSSTNVAVWARSGFNNRCDNCTVIDSASTAFRADNTPCIGPLCPYPDTNWTFYGINNSAFNSFNKGFSIFAQTGGWGLDYVNTYIHATAYDPAFHPNLTNNTTMNPLLGSCLLWVPASSPLKGAGFGGADIGANILYRYQNGFLTGTRLWNLVTGDFPHGALVAGVNDIAGDSAFDVDVRLNVNSGGCPFPVGY